MAVEGLVYNMDLAGLVQKLDRAQYELQHSVSSGVSLFNEFDITRVEHYLAGFTTYLDWVIAQPHLDLPESHPREVPIEDEPVRLKNENESINDMARMISVTRAELINCQSARMPAQMMDFDVVRMRKMVDKMEKYLTEYVVPATPLDLPESSPKRLMPESGRVGV